MKAEIEKLFHQIHAIISSHEPKDNSLLGGGLGLAHYYFTLYQLFENDQYAEKALDLVEQAANLQDEDAKVLFGPTFSSGGAGLGYIIKTFHNDGLLDMELDEELNDLDEYLYQSGLDMIRQDGNLDFLHGTAGIIHYFTHRLPDPSVYEKTMNLVMAFLEKKVTTPHGTWFSSYVMDTDDRTEINLSLSHGQTAFLLILMNAYRKGIHLPEIPPIIESGVNQLLQFRLYPKPGDELVSFFPSTVKSQNTEQMLVSNRLAWCYGDLNMLLLLYEAAVFLNKPEWKTMANEMGALVVKRKSKMETAVVDAHFCHGSAGLVQTYQRLFELSGLVEYDEAAQYWLKQTILLVQEELSKDFYQTKETAFLEGLPGVNMALAASLSDKPVNWGRFLLL
jgi:lantibiotic biosynthesis protein